MGPPWVPPRVCVVLVDGVESGGAVYSFFTVCGKGSSGDVNRSMCHQRSY